MLQCSDTNRVDKRCDRYQKRKGRAQDQTIDSFQQELEEAKIKSELIQTGFDEYKEIQENINAGGLIRQLEEADIRLLANQKAFQNYKEEVRDNNCLKDAVIDKLRGTKKELSNIVRNLKLNLEDTTRSLNLSSDIICKEIVSLGEYLKKKNPSHAFCNHE